MSQYIFEKSTFWIVVPLTISCAGALGYYLYEVGRDTGAAAVVSTQAELSATKSELESLRKAGELPLKETTDKLATTIDRLNEAAKSTELSVSERRELDQQKLQLETITSKLEAERLAHAGAIEAQRSESAAQTDHLQAQALLCESIRKQNESLSYSLAKAVLRQDQATLEKGMSVQVIPNVVSIGFIRSSLSDNSGSFSVSELGKATRVENLQPGSIISGDIGVVKWIVVIGSIDAMKEKCVVTISSTTPK
jgi:hypothetical protein